ncbi:hypothetical protein L7F22_001946 [Adiantum nelumboides]|nr:hypothetical protein [Adiantum nelumboides]
MDLNGLAGLGDRRVLAERFFGVCPLSKAASSSTQSLVAPTSFFFPGAFAFALAVQTKLLKEETQSKADKSPVTVADYGSQALISWALQRECGSETFSMVAEEDADDLRGKDGLEMLLRITDLVNEAIIAEGVENAPKLTKENVLEAVDRGRSQGGSIGRHWVLDPIDGTKGFVRGDQYAVALALLDEGEVVLGVLACPNLPLKGVSVKSSSGTPIGCLFSARKGAGAMLQSLDDSFAPQKVHVSDVDDPAFATFCESFEAAHSRQSLTERIAKIMGVKAAPVRIDSQAKYGAMARGDAAIYMRFPHVGYREKIWDHAAGCIVIEEAGGVVRDAAGNRLDFSKGRYLDVEHGIMATNSKLMPTLLASVQTALEAEKRVS